MPIINLQKFYYPEIREDIFVEVSDEVSEAMLRMRREENNRTSKIRYHKAYFSLDCGDGIENAAPSWAQPSPEDILVQREDEAYHDLLLARLEEAMSTLTPTQARRVRARFMEGMKFREIAEADDTSASNANESVRAALKKLRKYFKKRGWELWEN